MENQSIPSSEIVNYYKHKCVFITGATGFLGKVLIEKLIRSCYDLDKIFILIRPKRGVSVTERLNEIFNCKVFNKKFSKSFNNFETFFVKVV